MSTRSETLLAVVLMALLSVTSAVPEMARAQDADSVVTVKMVDRGGGEWRFDPAEIKVEQGDLIRFVQKDTAPHNVEFTDVPQESRIEDLRMGPFLLQRGQTYEIKIDHRFAKGIYDFVCTPHAALGMVGRLEVVTAAQAVPTQ